MSDKSKIKVGDRVKAPIFQCVCCSVIGSAVGIVTKITMRDDVLISVEDKNPDWILICQRSACKKLIKKKGAT